ncbi:hypothetical protein ACR6C2_34945 [Streptomyces sp. INA 01156]
MNAWLEEAVSDIEEGLDQADRFPPGSRHLRGVLAMAQLDHVARTWTPAAGAPTARPWSTSWPKAGPAC